MLDLKRLRDTGCAVADMTMLGSRWPALLGPAPLALALLVQVAMMLGSAALVPPSDATSPYLIADTDFTTRLLLQVVDFAAVVVFIIIYAAFRGRQKANTLLVGLIYIGIPLGVLMSVLFGAEIALTQAGLADTLLYPLQFAIGVISLVLVAGVFRSALQMRAGRSLFMAFLLMVLMLLADGGVQLLLAGQIKV
ncbi:MAG: hypothetical protein GC134_09010 [Proteobacteria bacterium]|nr:hypothetical protein [Pseudomonadota bacterium]